MLTVGKLARLFSISRSTLLYYDQIGLLCPSARSAANYRLYTDGDVTRMGKIIHFRQAGLSLENIALLLAHPGDQQQQILEQRLIGISRELEQLRQQQQVIVRLLKQRGQDADDGVQLTKQQWVQTLEAEGLDEADMQRWHREFERQSPRAHQAFLESLGIDEDEVTRIRVWSAR